MNTELLQGLKNYIESLTDGGKINLINFAEDEGIEASEELLTYLWNDIKHLNIRSSGVVNGLVKSIIVY